MALGEKATLSTTPPVQEYDTAPPPYKITEEPIQTAEKFEDAVTKGNGLTVIEKLNGKPIQPSAVGVTYILSNSYLL